MVSPSPRAVTAKTLSPSSTATAEKTLKLKISLSFAKIFSLQTKLKLNCNYVCSTPNLLSILIILKHSRSETVVLVLSLSSDLEDCF